MDDAQAALSVLERILKIRIRTGQITLHIHEGTVKVIETLTSTRLGNAVDVAEKPGLH